MRKLTLTFAALLAGATFTFAGPESIPTSGKEMKETMPVTRACDFSWTGFYVGVRAGGGFSSNTDTEFRPLPGEASFGMVDRDLDLDLDGFVGGGELGYNFQIGRWFVLGVEADFSGTTLDDSAEVNLIEPGGFIFPDGYLRAGQEVNWFGTARGRVGFVPLCRLLVYATGGLAYGSVDYFAETERLSNYRSDFNETNIGWTGGGGLEYALTHHLSLKVEYLYVDLDNESRTANPVPVNAPFQVHNRWETQFHTVTGGLNFKF